MDQLLLRTRKVYYPKGLIIFSEGDPGDFLLVILKGQVKIVLFGEGGEEVLLYKLGQGAFFGELALLDQCPRSATVVTLDDTHCLQLRAEEFENFIQNDRKLCSKILVHLSGRVRDMTDQIRSLSTQDVYGRIIRCYIRLARQSGEIDTSRIEVENPPSQKELANMISSTRETVNRALKVLQVNGFITEIQGRVILENKAIKQYFPFSL